MVAVMPKFKDGGVVPTYTPLAQIANGVMVGSVPTAVVVEFATNGVQVTTGASYKVAGVAVTDASAPGDLGYTQSTDAFGRLVTDITDPDLQVTVDTGGAYMCKYVAAVAAGLQVKSAAAGQVTLWVQGTDDPALIVGRCIDQAGAASGGAALTLIKV